MQVSGTVQFLKNMVYKNIFDSKIGWLNYVCVCVYKTVLNTEH